jgi:hypothetical protein
LVRVLGAQAMSFNLHLCSYEHGQPAGISERDVRGAFGDVRIREEATYWHIEYDHEVMCCDVYFSRLEDDSTRIKSLMVNSPVNDDRLWNSLFCIMQLGNVVLFFPGDRSPLFANKEAVKHFPKDMIEALGEPQIISSGAEILAAINMA